MNRRTFLATAGTVASSTLAGCAETPSAETEDATPPRTPGLLTEQSRGATERIPYANQYASVVDLGAIGGDPHGNRPIDDLLRTAVADDTLVFFPPGRYRITSAIEFPAFERVGLVGHDATIVPERGDSGYLFSFGRPSMAHGLRFEGFTFDFGAKNTGPRAIQARVDDELVVRDITVRGRQDTDQGVTRFDVTAADGRGEVTRLRLPDGGKPETAATGCLVGPASTGHLTFSDCHVAGFPNNGLYTSPADGPVTVIGGTYANSGIANVRVSGPSLVEGVTVRCDRSVAGITNMRGIRIRGGAGTVVRDCTIDFHRVHSSDGAIVCSPQTGSATIENTTVQIDTDGVAAVRAKEPSSYDDTVEPRIHCRGLTVTGSAARDFTIKVIERPGCTFEGVCIDQTGADRNGILLRRSGNSRVAGAISVPGVPLRTEESTNVSNSLSPVRDGC